MVERLVVFGGFAGLAVGALGWVLGGLEIRIALVVEGWTIVAAYWFMLEPLGLLALMRVAPLLRLVIIMLNIVIIIFLLLTSIKLFHFKLSNFLL